MLKGKRKVNCPNKVMYITYLFTYVNQDYFLKTVNIGNSEGLTPQNEK